MYISWIQFWHITNSGLNSKTASHRCDYRFANSEFDRLHMTIGLQTGRRTVFAYRFANRSSCVNALLQAATQGLVSCRCANSLHRAESSLLYKSFWENNPRLSSNSGAYRGIIPTHERRDSYCSAHAACRRTDHRWVRGQRESCDRR